MDYLFWSFNDDMEFIVSFQVKSVDPPSEVIKEVMNCTKIANRKDDNDNTQLTIVLEPGWHVDVIRNAVDRSSNVVLVNFMGQSCIGYVPHPSETPEVIQLLLKTGAQVTAYRQHKFYLECSVQSTVDGNVLKNYLQLTKEEERHRMCSEVMCRVLRSEKFRPHLFDELVKIDCRANDCFVHESSFHCYLDESPSNKSKDLHEDVIRMLLDNVSEVRRFDGVGRSPLCLALRHSQCKAPVVKLLLRGGPAIRDCWLHQSPLHCYLNYFSLTGNITEDKELDIDIIRLLVQNGAEVNLLNYYGFSPLYMVLHFGRCSVEILRLLLDAGAEMSECSIHNSIFNCYLALECSLTEDVVKLFLERNFSVNEPNGEGDLPLHFALRSCQYEVSAIKLLMEHPDMDIRQTGFNNSTYLHCALQNSSCKLSVVKDLLQLGANVDALDHTGLTPLQVATENTDCDWNILKLLLEHGSQLCSFSVVKPTPLEVVLMGSPNVDIVRLFLSAGAPIEVMHDRKKASLLEIAFVWYVSKQSLQSLECLYVILKYTLLKDPGFDFTTLIKKWIPLRSEQQNFFITAYDCIEEVQKMKSLFITPDYTLYNFAVGWWRLMDFDSNSLLSLLSVYPLPNYFDLISLKIQRGWMEDILHEMLVYRNSNLPSGGNKKNVLDSGSVCRIGYFLSDKDLLSFIVAFYNPQFNRFNY